MCLSGSEGVMLLGAVPSSGRPEWCVSFGSFGGVSRLWVAFAVRVVCPRFVAGLSGVSLPSVPPLLLSPSVVCPRRFVAAGRSEWRVPAGFPQAGLSGVSPPVQPPAGRSGVSPPRVPPRVARPKWCVPAVGRFRRLQFPGRELCGAANCGGRMSGGAG